MNLISVKSSNILAIGYQEHDSKLFIQFASEKIYEYNDVPKHIYEEFLNCESKGKFFHKSIHGRYYELELKEVK